MPIQFESKTHASVLMLNETAETFLGIMGHNAQSPGAIRAVDIPSALEKLKVQSYADNEQQTEDADERVSQRNRALPLINLLEHAVLNDEIVSWKNA